MKNNSKVRDFASILAICLLGFIIVVPLLAKGIVSGHDAGYHVNFIRSLNESLHGSGNKTARILDLIGQDFGFGSGLFYSLLPAGIAVLFMNLLNLNLVGAIALEMFLLFSLSGIVTYFFAKRVFKNKAYALITSICYTAFPYFLTNLYARFAFSELFITLALPMIIFGIYELVENKNYKLFFPLFTLGTALAATTHIALTVFIGIFVGVYLLVNIKKIIKEKTYFALIASCLVVLFLVSFFYIPMLMNFGEIEIGKMAENNVSLWVNSCSIFYKYYLVAPTYLSLGVFIILTYMFIKKPKTRQLKMLYVFVAVTLLMVSPIFPWFLLGFKPFNMIQFPWRIYAIVALPMAFSITYVFKELKISANIKFKKLAVAFIVVVSLVLGGYLGIGFGCVKPRIVNSNYQFASWLDPQNGLGSAKKGDYYPNGTTNEYVFARGNNLVLESDMKVAELAHYQTHNALAFFVAKKEAGYITLKIPFDCCEDVVVTRYISFKEEGERITPNNINNHLNIVVERLEVESQYIIEYKDGSKLEQYLKENPFEFITKSGDVVATNFEKQHANSYKVDFAVKEKSVVELPTFYYKGYSLTYKTSSGETKSLTPIHGENGFIEVELTESGTLQVKFDAKYVKYSNIISLLGFDLFLVAMALILFVPRKFYARIANWMDEFLQSHKNVAEIIRFIIVGGISTLIDMFTMGVVMYLMQPAIYRSFINVFINTPSPSTLATIVGTTAGYLVGMIVNYVLSIIFVFNEKGNSKSVKGFIVFMLLSTIGLGINMLGTYVGYSLLHINQWVTKIIMIIVVLIYNYISKRLVIFKKKKNSLTNEKKEG